MKDCLVWREDYAKMQLTFDKEVWKRILLFSVLVFSIFALGYYFKNIFFNVAIAISIAIMFSPFMKILQRHGFSKLQSLLIVLTATSIACTLLFLIFIPLIISEFNILITDYPDVLDTFVARVDNFLRQYSLDLGSLMAEYRVNERTTSYLTDILAAIMPFFINFVFIVPITASIFLLEGHAIKRSFLGMIPNEYFELTVNIVGDIENDLSDFIRAKGVETLIIGVISVIGYYVIGLPGALIFGIFAGVMNIIPYFGPLIGAIPPFIIAFVLSSGNYTLMVNFVIVALAVQLIDNLVVIPFIVSKIVHMHAITSILILFIFGSLFGPVGMIISIPVYNILKIIFREVYSGLVVIQKYKNSI